MKLSIYRFDPDADKKPYMQDYEVTLQEGDNMLLDALLRVKHQDDSLSLRKSCREGVCGSDALNINGKNALACVTRIADLTEPVVIRPLPGLPVIRDLIVDMDQFYEHYNSVDPYLKNDDPLPERLENLEDPYRLYRCHNIMNCVDVCPKKLNPNAAIVAIKDLKIARARDDKQDKPPKKIFGIKLG